MKIRILDRILVALAGILVLAGCAALAAQLFFQKDIVSLAGNVLQNEKYRVWLIVILVLLVILGCYCLLILFRHRGKSEKTANCAFHSRPWNLWSRNAWIPTRS